MVGTLSAVLPPETPGTQAPYASLSRKTGAPGPTASEPLILILCSHRWWPSGLAAASSPLASLQSTTA